MTQRTLRRAACALPLFAFALPAAAQGGCEYAADGNYQLGQTAQITVYNDMAPGTLVRNERAHGDGIVLANCEEGRATFEGAYVAQREGGLVPLTVHGQPSGFGMNVYIKELKDERLFEFPHRYERTFREGEPVRSNEAEIGYRVIRTSGPVRFGPVDRTTIAEQWTYEPNGARTRSFRHLKIYELSFVRPVCEITAETLNQTVQVGTYHVGNFATPERATPWVPFRLTVEKCAEPVGMIANFTFGTPADADPVVGGLFSLSGPENVGLELANDDKKVLIRPGEPFAANALGTGRSYEFNVRLRETRPTVRGGDFHRPVVVQVDFN